MLLQSCLHKKVGQVPGTVTVMCGIFKTSYLLGKHLTNGELEGLVVPFGALVECHPISAKDHSLKTP